ncbi:MAG: putative nucleoside permease NupX [Phycisphaerae bacterium]|nr:putative nucleoside permease NupX [Phycisphaerae bacterium]
MGAYRYNLLSLAGLVTLILAAWLLSKGRRRVNWRVLVWGTALQLGIAGLVFLAPGSRGVFGWVNGAVFKVLEASNSGQEFVFGPLAVGPGRPGSVGFILATQALPLIIFFAALMQLLYYYGIMQWAIRGFAWLFTRLMRVSGAESLCAASNIFVGVESATTIRPYLAGMTRSELCTILTAGMATIASTVLGLYVSFLGAEFPDIAGHLISASIISAPAAILMSKLLLPETGQPETLGRTVALHYQREESAIEAIINGAMAGVKLLVGVAALLIAFLGLLALLNLALHGVGGLVNHQTGWTFDWSLENLLGYAFRPIAWLIGVPWQDAQLAGRLLGERLVVTEVKAYQDLDVMLKAGQFAHPERTRIVISYALCGFAHVASLAIFVGGIAGLVPERRKDLAAVAPRALLAATLACLMTGAVAGLFFMG